MNFSLLTTLLAITLILSIIWHYNHPTVKISLIKGKTMNMKAFIAFLGIFTFASLILDYSGDGDNIIPHIVLITTALIVAIVGTIIERLPESQSQLSTKPPNKMTELPDKMERTIFREAYFCGLDLRSKIFKECDLRQADFRQADLENAQFIRCDLRGVNFTEANMINVKMPGSVYNSQPTLKEDQEKEDAKVKQLLGWDNADLEVGHIEGPH